MPAVSDRSDAGTENWVIFGWELGSGCPWHCLSALSTGHAPRWRWFSRCFPSLFGVSTRNFVKCQRLLLSLPVRDLVAGEKFRCENVLKLFIVVFFFWFMHLICAYGATRAFIFLASGQLCLINGAWLWLHFAVAVIFPITFTKNYASHFLSSHNFIMRRNLRSIIVEFEACPIN